MATTAAVDNPLANQNNTRLASRPSGCLIWMVFDPENRSFAKFRWFGDRPGAPLPNLGDRAVRHSRANRNGEMAVLSA